MNALARVCNVIENGRQVLLQMNKGREGTVGCPLSIYICVSALYPSYTHISQEAYIAGSV